MVYHPTYRRVELKLNGISLGSDYGAGFEDEATIANRDNMVRSEREAGQGA